MCARLRARIAAQATKSLIDQRWFEIWEDARNDSEKRVKLQMFFSRSRTNIAKAQQVCYRNVRIRYEATGLNAVTMRLLVFALAAADFRVRFDVETTEVNLLQQFV